MSNPHDRTPPSETREAAEMAALALFSPRRQTLFWIDDDFLGDDPPAQDATTAPHPSVGADMIEGPGAE